MSDDHPSRAAKAPESFAHTRGYLSDGRGEHKPGWQEHDPSLHAHKEAKSGAQLPPHRSDRKLVKTPLAEQFRARMAAAKRANA
jgi:hypothetical protein